MTTETNRLKSKLSTLDDSLDDLEAQLEPLLSQTLPETVVGLETIQQAKLQVVLPYLVYDLIFIYLKSKGIDPKTHPVVQELDHIREYFDKIKNAEEANKKKPTIDKAAANRFIKHAINQVKYGRPPGDNAEATPSDLRVPVKITSKMVERAEYEKELGESGSEEEEDLKIFEESPDGDNIDDEEVPETKSSKAKGKQKAVDVTMDNDEGKVGSKRRRPQMDPFGDYGKDEEPSTPLSQKSKKKKKGASLTGSQGGVDLIDASQDNSGQSTPLSVTSLSKKEAKAARKAKRKAKKLAEQ